ncbi:MAG TPA: hypothetical protein PLH23_11760 [Hyphomonadaceae bacterium]|nr:hypothetical protein [Hyphomonadaceae bacterium]HPI48936.1 hypothetical protein [Hyphomonadaceae bacterium]
MSFKLMVGAALGALSLQGCASIGNLGASGVAENIEGNAATLNDAHTRAMTAIIAMNVLRARDRWPTNYTTLSGIKSNPTLSLNGSASFSPLGLGNANAPFVGSSANVSRNESANAEYSVNPFSNNDKTQGLLKPIQPEQLENYWLAGWPRETLMWLFVDAVTFAGESQPWYIDGDEFSASPSPSDAANTRRYGEIIDRAKRGQVDFGELPAPSLDQRACSPYDPVYLRETLGGAGSPDGGGNRGAGMTETIRTVESLTGRQLVLSEDPRTPAAGEAVIAPDRFNRRLLLCDTVDTKWGFMDAATGAPLASIRTRSFDDMIYFLGETLRSGSEDKPTVAGNVILFQTYHERGDRPFAVRVEHAGQVYFIAPQTLAGESTGPKDVTGNVLSLLNQLYLLAQSDEFLRAPEARVR